MLIVEGMAQAKVLPPLPCGVLELEFSGVFTRASARAMLARMAGAVVPQQRVPGVLVCFRNAVFDYSGGLAVSPELLAFASSVPVFALLAAPERYASVRATCALLLRHGAMATCWMDSQRPRALEWLHHYTRLHGQSRPVLRPQKPVLPRRVPCPVRQT